MCLVRAAPSAPDSPPARLRVLLAGHGRGARAALRATLEQGDLAVCGEVEDVAGAVAAVARERPDVCLLDGVIPGGAPNGAAAIVRAAPLVRVVILAASASDAELLDAVAAGASGHLRTDLQACRLIAALRDVAAGRPAFPRRLEAVLVAALHDRA
jgi:DNA-binding NarL/FixJ family response regulator